MKLISLQKRKIKRSLDELIFQLTQLHGVCLRLKATKTEDCAKMQENILDLNNNTYYFFELSTDLIRSLIPYYWEQRNKTCPKNLNNYIQNRKNGLN